MQWFIKVARTDQYEKLLFPMAVFQHFADQEIINLQ